MIQYILIDVSEYPEIETLLLIRKITRRVQELKMSWMVKEELDRSKKDENKE